MTARAVLTYADYVAIPEDGHRYELRDGELSVTPAPARGIRQSSGISSSS